MNIPPPTKPQARLIWLALTGLAMAVLVGLVAGVIWGLGRVLDVLSPVLWPLAVGGVLAYLLDPLVDKLQGRGMTRPRAILCVFGAAFLVLTALLSSIAPQVVGESRQLISRVPAYAAQLEARAQKWIENPPPWLRRVLEREMGTGAAPAPTSVTNDSGEVTTDADAATSGSLTNNPAATGGLKKETLQTATNWAAQALPRIGSWLFGQFGRVASWFGVIAGLALIPVYAFYFLLEKEAIASRWTNYLPVSDSNFKNELVFVLNSVNNYLIAFFRGQVLVAMADGILYGLGFLIIGLPYALLIGVMAVFLTMIPFLGAITTCVTALLIAIVQFGDWSHPLMVLVVFGCVQTLEGLVISPKIMGGRVGLHPVTIIIAVM
ncbi:MAG TPA: AI-2E family transporter, partial [Verrucomicrobiae bacterium]|nr:AI-2E family transporter [Verrucomicrobiae bacterium]